MEFVTESTETYSLSLNHLLVLQGDNLKSHPVTIFLAVKVGNLHERYYTF